MQARTDSPLRAPKEIGYLWNGVPSIEILDQHAFHASTSYSGCRLPWAWDHPERFSASFMGPPGCQLWDHPARRAGWVLGSHVCFWRHVRRRGGQQRWCSGRSTWLWYVRSCGAGWTASGCVRRWALVWTVCEARPGAGCGSDLPASFCCPRRRRRIPNDARADREPTMDMAETLVSDPGHIEQVLPNSQTGEKAAGCTPNQSAL